MENNSDEQFIIIQAEIEANNQEMNANKQDYDEKMAKFTEESKAILAEITDHINTLKSLSTQKDSPKTPDPNNLVPTYRRDLQLDGGKSTKIGGMWTLKHDIISPIFYELLIKTELKGDTDLYLNNFYNHINTIL